MRLLNLSCFIVFSFPLIFGQIKNAGFEDWITDPDSNNNPVGWQTTNSFPIVNVEPYTPACQGNFALKVKTVNAGFILPGVAILETAYSFNQNPTKFTVCVKATIMPGDIAFIILALMKGDSVVASMDSCTFKIESTINEFTNLEFPIAYQSNLLPDSLIIFVMSGLLNGQVGTELIVDEVSFNAASSSESENKDLPEHFVLNQNYPNPFNPSTKISWQTHIGSLQIVKVYNLLGQEVATLVNEYRPAGRYEIEFNASGLTNGVYFYQLQVGDFFETKKLILIK